VAAAPAGPPLEAGPVSHPFADNLVELVESLSVDM
jgi:hypothetical protein